MKFDIFWIYRIKWFNNVLGSILGALDSILDFQLNCLGLKGLDLAIHIYCQAQFKLASSVQVNQKLRLVSLSL